MQEPSSTADLRDLLAGITDPDRRRRLAKAWAQTRREA
jgi:hypothetical protein